ncbi:MAG: hypothetical protein ACFFD1_12590 [Candidatus Thorarchaeota archaeon]
MADPSPNLRYLVLTQLLDKSDKDIEVNELKEERLADPLVKDLIFQQQNDGSWNPGLILGSDHRTIFQTTCDVLKRLGYLGFNSTYNFVSRGVEFLFRLQNNDGSWNSSIQWKDSGNDSRYDWIPLHTALPLRAIVSCGYAEDTRVRKAFDWLLEKQLPDGAWPTGKAGGGVYGYQAGYRRLPHSRFGCRSNTTGVLSCFAYHPQLRKIGEIQKAMDHLLSCETKDRMTLGFEVARIMGFETIGGTLTYFAKLDQALTLDLCWRIGVSSDDKRLKNILSFIENEMNEFNLIQYFSKPQATRWINFDILRSITNLKMIKEWVSKEPTTPFTRYFRVKKRF